MSNHSNKLSAVIIISFRVGVKLEACICTHVCVCVCVCVCVRVCVCRAHTLTLTHAHTHTHSLSYPPTHTHTHTHTHSHTQTHSHTHTHSRTQSQLVSQSATELKTTHTTPQKHYVDDQTMGFKPGANGGCVVSVSKIVCC